MLKKWTKLNPAICWYVTFECFGSELGSVLERVFVDTFNTFQQEAAPVTPDLQGGEHDPALVQDIAWKVPFRMPCQHLRRQSHV